MNSLQWLQSFRKLVGNCPDSESKLRALRAYSRSHIRDSWHYPDDLEPCLYCGPNPIPHRPNLGVRGFLGTGNIAIVSMWPSDDRHFKLKQAKEYYWLLSKHSLENAFLTDGFNINIEETGAVIDQAQQEALFQIQIETVRPTGVFVMDMHSYPRRTGRGWTGKGILDTVAERFASNGFSIQVNRNYRPVESELRVATVSHETLSFQFDLFTIHHYTLLTSSRFAGSEHERQTKWQKRLAAALSEHQQLLAKENTDGSL